MRLQLSTAELKRKVLDLESELEQARAAKAESDNQVSELRKEVDSLSTKLQELRLEVELRVSKGRETLHLEMKRTQDRELNTHEELQRSLVQQIAEKDVTIADKNAVIVDLRASLEREETSGSGHPRVEDSDRISGHTEAGKTVRLPALLTFEGCGKDDDGAYKRWLVKIGKYAELLHWSDKEKLLQFELHLAGKAESVYEVLPPEEKGSFDLASKALGKRIQPAKREALSSAQLLRRRQRTGESVDDYVREFEQLFESSYGHQTDVDMTFKEILKRDIFVQGLLLKWQEKVLPSAMSFADALYQARAAEEQEQQLGAMHPKVFHSRKEGL